MQQEVFATTLARCFLAGEPTLHGILRRSNEMLGRSWKWLARTAQRYVETIHGQPRFRQENVVAFLQHDRDFQRAWKRLSSILQPAHWLTEAQRMQPVEAAVAWDLPRIESAAELADWFWLDDSDLEWFADLHTLAAKNSSQQLTHYHYRVLAKNNGGFRLIEAPKRRIKSLQRQILGGILDQIPAHPAVHGFVKGRSILTFANPHAGKPVILRMDLKNFFPSFGCARVQAFFRTAGYPELVANRLAGICTNTTPAPIWKATGEVLYSRRHLPQGAPTSPALANLCAYRMDCRLTGLAKSADVVYTRYADDLAFSGGSGFARHAERFSAHAAAILLDEGFSVQHRKTRIMRQSVPQHLAGLVVNQRANVPRAEWDKLKAILTNCVRYGAESQNREAHSAWRQHLEGRVAFVEMVNPARGTALRHIAEQIRWS